MAFMALGVMMHGKSKGGTTFIVCGLISAVLAVGGCVLSITNIALYDKEKVGSYKVSGQYVIVYTDNGSAEYYIEPITETVILVKPNGNVALNETKEELLRSIEDKGYTEYKKNHGNK